MAFSVILRKNKPQGERVMGKNELRERIRQFIKTPAMIKLSLAIVVAIIAAVGILAGVKSFSSKEAAQVASLEKDANTTQEAKEDTEDMQGVAETKEEVTEETGSDSEKLDYAAVFLITINPKLRIYVDADGIVLKMEKANADAEILLDNFTWENKSLQDCFADLLIKAHDDGFLHDSAKVSIEMEEKKESVAINTSVMFEKMETAVAIVCHEKEIEVKVAMKEQNSEEVMEKEITADTLDTLTTDNTILPTDTTDLQTPFEHAEEVVVPEVVAPTTEVKNESSSSGSDNGNKDNGSSSGKDKPVVTPPTSSEYKLVWEDNFNGTELNRNDWNVEEHDPGWVNAELQAYVDSEENIYVKDGNLVLQAIETVHENGDKSYTSGRVNTQNKHDFKYGKFEARIKVPSGMGFLPAFWMMPTDEQYYGQWPKCGEIDIMEVMGQSTDTLHGTIHYGEPHGQKQGTYVLDASKADFAETFHVYTCEWEPGKITWYVDGVKFHEANDWYTKREGFDEVAYPAPFDQPFYMILNVAVGGSWVGYPDETTEFGDNAQMVVDYVKVYQKDSYDENVVKPDKAEVPDSAIGANLLTNGEFTNVESMKDGNSWEFLSANGGEGNAEIVSVNGNNALQITTGNAGTVDYSIQIVQGPIALKQGNKYKVTFDAWADEARQMKALISAPDLNYIRYWGDQTVNLTTEKQTFTYEFDMEEAGDANSRFEMTFGAMNSTATVYIDNVKVEKTGTFEIAEDVKTVLPDGNFVYNSGFDTGADRMKYWTVDSNIAGVSYLATNINGVREFKAVVPNTASALTDVVLKQEDTAITGGKNYLFTFEAYGTEAKTIKAVITPDTAEEMAFNVDVTTSKKGYSFNLTMPEGVNGADVKFLIGAAGTTYIDNVRVQEDANVINGNFASGTAGWELYAYTPGDVTFAIDELDNGSGTPAAALNISKSGPIDWHIQLKQPVTVEQGKKYRVSFDAWSTVERDFVFAIQRNADNKGGGEWTSYSGDINEAMSTNGFKHYSKEFDMTWVTDDVAELKFTLGAVNGKEINTPHTVFIDNVVLEEIGTCEIPDGSDEPEVVEGENMFANPNFEGMDGWIATWDSQWDANNPEFTATATTKTENNTLVYDITNVGKDDYSVQLKQEGLDFEEGATYRVSFDVSSTVARNIKFALMKGNDWYAGIDEIAVSTEISTVTFDFKPLDGKATYEDLAFQLSLGKVGESAQVSTITFANMKLVKLETKEPEQAQTVNVILADVCLTKTKDADGNAITDGSNMLTGVWGGSAQFTTEDGKVKATITNPGTNPWDVQLQEFGVNLEANCEYKLTFKGSADTTKLLQVGLQQNGGSYTVYSLINNQNIAARLDANEKSYTIVFTMNATGDDNATLFFNLGNVNESNAGYILVADGEQQEEPNEGDGAQDDLSEPVEGEMISNGNFANGTSGWSINNNSPAVATVDTSTGKVVFDISNVGTTNWHLQLAQSGLHIEQGATYAVSFDISSSIDRQIEWTMMEDGNKTNSWSLWYAGSVLNLKKDEEQTINVEFTANEECSEAMFQITMAPNGDGMPLTELVNTPVQHTITIDNISLVKVSDAPTAEPLMTFSLRGSEAATEEPIIEEDSSEEVTTEESAEETSTEEETTEESGETIQEDVIVDKGEEVPEESIEESSEESESLEEV